MVDEELASFSLLIELDRALPNFELSAREIEDVLKGSADPTRFKVLIQALKEVDEELQIAMQILAKANFVEDVYIFLPALVFGNSSLLVICLLEHSL